MGSSLSASETDIAWVAGIIDGEGSIGLWNYRTKATRTQKKRPYLAIALNCEATMIRVRDLLGPSLKLYSPKLAKAHYKEQWRFAVANRKVLAICELIQPYSTTKRDAIEAVFQYYSPKAEAERNAENQRKAQTAKALKRAKRLHDEEASHP